MSGQSFAEALERAIARSKQPVPLLNGPVEELPASELKKPFPRHLPTVHLKVQSPHITSHESSDLINHDHSWLTKSSLC
jgi:hypothetical protein